MEALHLVKEVSWDKDAVSCFKVYLLLVVNILKLGIFHKVWQKEVNRADVCLVFKSDVIVVVKRIFHLSRVNLLSINVRD